jgi:hypothetical protein
MDLCSRLPGVPTHLPGFRIADEPLIKFSHFLHIYPYMQGTPLRGVPPTEEAAPSTWVPRSLRDGGNIRDATVLEAARSTWGQGPMQSGGWETENAAALLAL